MLSLLVATSFAQSGPWFDECDLSYFGSGECRREAPEESPEATEETEVPVAPMKKGLRELDAEPFAWQAYEDPRDVRFWDDGGDWVPPRPLREVLAEPTPENVTRYRAWVAKKLELAQAGHQLLWGEAPQREATPKVDLVELERQRAAPRVDWANVQVVYFYQSSCPHCQKSKPVVAELQERGAEVIPVYLDRPDPAYGVSTPYTKEMAGMLQVEGTPTWLVNVGGTRTVVRGTTTLARLAKVVKFLEEQEGT